jgi:hypothetical protein
MPDIVDYFNIITHKQSLGESQFEIGVLNDGSLSIQAIVRPK